MAIKVLANVKLQIPAGKAQPSPPIGPALGQHGVDIKSFCKEFNAATQHVELGLPIPIVITIYADKKRSFSFVQKSPPAAVLLKKAAGVSAGSATPHTNKVGSVSQAQLADIAATKKDDLTGGDEDACKRILAGTARSMGIEVVA